MAPSEVRLSDDRRIESVVTLDGEEIRFSDVAEMRTDGIYATGEVTSVRRGHFEVSVADIRARRIDASDNGRSEKLLTLELLEDRTIRLDAPWSEADGRITGEGTSTSVSRLPATVASAAEDQAAARTMSETGEVPGTEVVPTDDRTGQPERYEGSELTKVVSLDDVRELRVAPRSPEAEQLKSGVRNAVLIVGLGFILLMKVLGY